MMTDKEFELLMLLADMITRRVSTPAAIARGINELTIKAMAERAQEKAISPGAIRMYVSSKGQSTSPMDFVIDQLHAVSDSVRTTGIYFQREQLRNRAEFLLRGLGLITD
jgi:hypothetical protein